MASCGTWRGGKGYVGLAGTALLKAKEGARFRGTSAGADRCSAGVAGEQNPVG